MFNLGGDDNNPFSLSGSSGGSQETSGYGSGSPTSTVVVSMGNPTIRRGPGRPRLKPGGPPNVGSRGSYRPRKPARPLPVPLPTDSAPNSSQPTPGSGSYTSYLYDFQDNDF